MDWLYHYRYQQNMAMLLAESSASSASTALSKNARGDESFIQLVYMLSQQYTERVNNLKPWLTCNKALATLQRTLTSQYPRSHGILPQLVWHSQRWSTSS